MARERVQSRLKKDRPRYFFKEWRKYRNLNQEALGERVGMTASSISQLENGKQGFTDSTLEALAHALQTDAGSLLMRNPLQEDALWTLIDSLKPAQRADAVKYLQFLQSTGTDG